MIYRARESTINKGEEAHRSDIPMHLFLLDESMLWGLDDRVLLRELDDLVDIAEGKTRDRICTTVVDSDTTRLSIV